MRGQSAAKISDKYGDIIVLEDSYLVNGKSYCNTLCTCGKESIRRVDHLKGKLPIYCKYCKDKLSAATPKIETVLNTLYATYKWSATNRGYSFDLSKEEFKAVIEQDCYYCGDEPQETTSSKKVNRTDTPYRHNGADRRDNSIGYTLENVVPCCGICNSMKNRFTEKDFYSKITKIYNKHLK